MTPIEKYNNDIETNGFQSDPAQRAAVEALDRLHHEYVDYLNFEAPALSMMQKLLGKSPEQATPPQGLYFWGGVGRGKTYLMDAFFDSLPTSQKMRVHFHRFCVRNNNQTRFQFWVWRFRHKMWTKNGENEIENCAQFSTSTSFPIVFVRNLRENLHTSGGPDARK